MTLFEECKTVLSNDFTVIQNNSVKDVMAILSLFPFEKGNLIWSKLKYEDYDNVNEIWKENIIKDNEVFVLADDINIPIFKTNFKLLSDHIYDVLALSPKLFIFNRSFILQPLFPTETLRLGVLIKKSHRSCKEC